MSSSSGFSLASILPAPSQPTWDRDEERQKEQQNQTDNPAKSIVSLENVAPPYRGGRKGWIPRVSNDFGDGGAFPEIHVAQYPLEMGRPETNNKAKNNALAVQLDAQGKVKYDLLARQGHGKDKVIVEQ